MASDLPQTGPGTGTSSPYWGKAQLCLPVIQKITSREGWAVSERLGALGSGLCPAPGLHGKGFSG